MLEMTLNIFRNFSGEKSTRQYPFVQRDQYKDVRGELFIEVDKCIFCMTCARKCPSQCITVDNKAGTWTCDPFACVYCGVCVDACPTNCLHQKTKYRASATQKSIMSHQGEPPKKKSKADKAEEAA